MKNLNNKQTEKIIYQLYKDRMNLEEELTFEERFDRDRAIIKVMFGNRTRSTRQISRCNCT